MIKKYFSIVTILAIFNVVLLTYTAWIKYFNEGCPTCNKFFFLPINSVTIALLGIAASLTLAVLSYFSISSKIFKYPMLLIALISASFASFLQIAQLLWAKNICYYCFSATIVFYLIFGFLFYEIIGKKLWSKYAVILQSFS